VALAQENPAAEQDHLDHFGLARPPFAPLTDPGEIHHVEQYSLLSRHLDAAGSNSGHLVVVRGADGSGKTTLLNRHVASLGEKAFFATIDQSCENETDFYCTFLRQLGFDNITGKPGELRHITDEFLIHGARTRDTVLLIIDNVHQVRPFVLQQLRLILAASPEARRVISAVITGNSHIRRIVDSPAMDSLRFREFADFHIRAYTESETGAYIRHRLRLAGDSTGTAFAPDSYAMIHRYSGGIPGKINELGGALLADAAKQKVRSINGELVRSLAESRQLPPHVVPVQGRGRRKTDGAADRAQPPGQHSVVIAVRGATPASSADVPGQSSSLEVTERDRKIAELSAKLSESEQELDRSAGLVRKLKAELESESSTTRSARKVFERAEQRISKLEGLQATLQETIAALRRELEVSREKAGRAVALQRELAIANEKIGKLQAEIAAQSGGATTSLVVLAGAPEKASEPTEQPARESWPQGAIVRFDVMHKGKLLRTVRREEISTRCMIGRDEDCELRLTSRSVSRHHALLVCAAAAVSIRDLNSVNGTLVNFERITDRELKTGDVVLIGDFQIRARSS